MRVRAVAGPAGLVQNRHFWRLVRVRALAGPNGSFLKGRACTESSFFGFGSGPGPGGPKRLIFKGRACTESSFLGFGSRAPLSCAVSWGLLTRAWSGWRRVIRIGDQDVVWAAPCHWDW